MFKILERVMLTPNICKMVVSAPRIAEAAKPGQFLIVRSDEKGERIPLTISDYDRENGTVTIVTQLIGASSPPSSPRPRASSSVMSWGLWATLPPSLTRRMRS